MGTQKLIVFPNQPTHPRPGSFFFERSTVCNLGHIALYPKV